MRDDGALVRNTGKASEEALRYQAVKKAWLGPLRPL